MVQLAKDEEIPEPFDFCKEVLKAKSEQELDSIVFGKMPIGWECYTRDQDPQYGWSLRDANYFRNTLILIMRYGDDFQFVL